MCRRVGALAVAQSPHSRLRGEPGGRLGGGRRAHRGMRQSVVLAGFWHQMRGTAGNGRQNRTDWPRMCAGRAGDAPRVRQQGRVRQWMVHVAARDAHRDAVPSGDTASAALRRHRHSCVRVKEVASLLHTGQALG